KVVGLFRAGSEVAGSGIMRIIFDESQLILSRRANNRVVLALTSFFLFCMSSAVIATVLPFFFVDAETSPANPLSVEVSSGGAL
nr:hypothetical protein [Tanacetum cinerariifolium]